MDDTKVKVQPAYRAKIKVFGVGGGGGNAVNNMIVSGLEGVEFIVGNTDAQALASNRSPIKMQLGEEVTKGLGAGADPEIGRAAARESMERIRAALEGADMVFVTAGMGGGTGTGGCEIVAEVAREMGALTVGVVTKPFLFEGKRRMKNAEAGINNLKKQVDTLITIPNQRLLSIAGRNSSLIDTFKRADDILFQAVKGISDLIIFEGLINVDFADVKSVMTNAGSALMGVGRASGEKRAMIAANMAVSSPLLEVSIEGARGILFNITGGKSLTMNEVNDAATIITQSADPDANIIFGASIRDDMGDDVQISVIAAGFDEARRHFGSNQRSTSFFMPSNDNKTETPKPIESKPEPVSGSSKFKVNHEEVNIEDDLDIPTFLRNKY